MPRRRTAPASRSAPSATGARSRISAPRGRRAPGSHPRLATSSATLSVSASASRTPPATSTRSSSAPRARRRRTPSGTPGAKRRLFLQSAGLQGVVPVPEVADLDDLIAAHPVRPPQLELGLDPAVPRPHPPPQSAHHPIPIIDQLIEFHLLRRIVLGQALELADGRVDPLHRALLGPPLRRPYDGVGVEQRPHPVEGPGCESPAELPHDLGFAPRHLAQYVAAARAGVGSNERG